MEKLKKILEYHPGFWGTVTYSIKYTLKKGEVCHVMESELIEESKQPKSGEQKRRTT